MQEASGKNLISIIKPIGCRIGSSEGDPLPDLERKTVMSSFDIFAVVTELRQIIIGKYVDNIYQIDQETFLFKFNPGNLSLIIEIGKRIHLTGYVLSIPSTPTQLCMALRKHLRNGKVTGITQHEFERIVMLQIELSKGKFQLVIEIFGKGNLILVGETEKIVLAAKYVRMRDRDIVRNGRFIHAPSSGINPLKATRNDIESLRSSDPMPAVKKVTRILAVGRVYAREILLQAKVAEDTLSNQLSDAQLDAIHASIETLVSDAQSQRMRPQILIDPTGTSFTVQPFPLRIYAGMNAVDYSTFNQAADEYFTSLAHGRIELTESKKREQEKEKLSRMLQMQLREKDNLQQEILRCTKIGDIIKRHAQEIGELTAQIQTRRSHDISFAEISQYLMESAKKGPIPDNYFKSLDPKNRKLSVQIEGEDFSLEFEETPHRNASNYFDIAKKLKQKLAKVNESIAKTKSELESFEVAAEKEARKETLLMKKKEREWYEKYHWFESSEGFLVLAGRDASTNETLINRHVDKEDIVFHGEVQGAPFAVIKTGGKTPGSQTLLETGIFAAAYSKAWSSGFSSADVYWVKPEQLSKKPPSGQYLKKGMFMVYGQRNYMKGMPLRIAIGVVDNGRNLTFISGPTTAVESKTNSFVELIPGKTRSASLAKKILYRLSKKVTTDATKKMKALGLEEIQRFIPSGTGDIVEEGSRKYMLT